MHSKTPKFGPDLTRWSPPNGIKDQPFDITLDMIPSEMSAIDVSPSLRCPIPTTSNNTTPVKHNIVSLMDSSNKDELDNTVFPKTRSRPSKSALAI